MTRRHRKGGRTTPKGTRPPHLRPVREPELDRSPIDDVIDAGAADLLDKTDPLAAEEWASLLLDMFESARSQARLDGESAPPFEQDLLERCRQRGDPDGLVVAAVVPPQLAEPASRVVAGLRRSVAGPPWLDAVGRAEPTRAWVATDVFGDQDSIILGFTQAGVPGEHAVVALVDHNLSGQAKDLWIAADLDATVETWRSNTEPGIHLDEAPIDEALPRLRDGMAIADFWSGDADLRTEDFGAHRAMVWARLRRAGLTDEPTEPPEISQRDREAIVADFISSPEGQDRRGLPEDIDVELLAHYLVDLRCDDEGRPLRWSPIVVEILLRDLAPRKLLLDPDETAALPAVLRSFIRFSAARTGLGERFVDEILAGVDDFTPEFLDRMANPEAAGPAKAMLAALQARGINLDDDAAISAALEDLVPMRLPKPPPGRRTKPVGATAEVIEAAERSLVLTRFATLSGFYGDGRKLTQTGQPRLADARALVDLLGTRDRLDEDFGDRVFKTRSAAELPELGFTIRWAVTAGVLRKEHGKLRATATWRRLDGKPLERWLKAADALPILGPLAGFHARNRYRDPDEILDGIAFEILDVIQDKALPYETVLDWICERVDAEFEWLTPYMQEPKNRRKSFDWDLDRLTQILGWAGIVERIDATVEQDRWIPSIERRVGGTLRLTPLGRWWLGPD